MSHALIGYIIGLIFALSVLTPFIWIILLYKGYYLYCGLIVVYVVVKNIRPFNQEWPAFQRFAYVFIGPSLAKYFGGIEWHQEHTHNLHKPKMYVLHPHGTAPMAPLCQWTYHPELANVKLLIADSLFLLPVIGEISSWMGNHRVSKKEMKRLMTSRQDIAIVVEGYTGLLIDNTSKEAEEFERFALKNKKGFIKYALEYNYQLIPVYTPNEATMGYNYKLPLFKLRAWIAEKFWIPLILVFGKHFFLFPNRQPVKTYVGKSIVLPQIINPTPTLLDRYHQIYIDQFVEFIEQHTTKKVKII